MGKETKRKDIVKYELPEVVNIKVGTEGTGIAARKIW